MKTVRVLLADRHPIVRRGLRSLLAERPDMELVGEAGMGADVRRLLHEQAPEVLILGLNLPLTASLDVARHLFEIESPVRVLVLSANDEEQHVYELLAYGVAGYVTKEDSPEAIVEATEAVASGETGWLSPRVTARLSKRRVRGTEERALSLSQREREILGLLAQGYRNRQIAEALYIATGTVKNHLTSIYEKLGVQTRLEAVAWAWQRGLVP